MKYNAVLVPVLCAISGFVSCTSSARKGIAVLPRVDSLTLEQALSSGSLKKGTDISAYRTSQYYVSKAEGASIYAQPRIDAPRVYAYYTGEELMVEEIGNGWGRLHLRFPSSSSEYDAGYFAYVQLSELTKDKESIQITEGHLNQVTAELKGAKALNYRTYTWPYPTSFYLDSLVHIELIDELTYREAKKARVDQLVIDPYSLCKSGNSTVLPLESISLDTKGGLVSHYPSGMSIEQGKLVLRDEPGVLEYSYLGRLSSQGAYVIHTSGVESSNYSLITPKTGRLVEEGPWGDGYPNLSPDGAYVISLSEPWMEATGTNLRVLKVDGEEQEYEEYANVLYHFWMPYEGSRYDYEARNLIAPSETQFWSDDNNFYLQITPIWGNQPCYVRVKILGKSVLQKASRFVGNLLPIG